MVPTPLEQLMALAEANHYRVTSSTGGKHNPGSLHGSGRAIDIDHKGVDFGQLQKAAAAIGARVLDERHRPPGQKVWGGPHYHIDFQNVANTNTPQQQPKAPQLDFNSELKRLKAENAALDKQLGNFSTADQFARAANTPDSNPLGAFAGGVAQGATAFGYKPGEINPKDALAQGAGSIVGSLFPIGAGAAFGGLPGAMAGAGAVGFGADVARQEAEVLAGERQGYNLTSPFIQGGLGAALTPIPFAARGASLPAAIASGAAVGGITGAAPVAIEMATDPNASTTAGDVLNAGLMGAGIGALGGGLLTGGNAAAVAPAVKPAIKEALRLTGGTIDDLPRLAGREARGLLPGAVEQRTAGEAPGVFTRDNLPSTVESVTVEDAPTVQPTYAAEAFDAIPETPVADPMPSPIREALDGVNTTTFMRKTEANKALKELGAGTHAIVSDAGRYRVLPKGEPIPDIPSQFKRGDTITIEGQPFKVLKEPFGDVEVRAKDGQVRILPREAVEQALQAEQGGADALATFKQRVDDLAPVDEVGEVTISKADEISAIRGILDEAQGVTALEMRATDFLESYGVKTKRNKSSSQGKNWIDVLLPGQKKVTIEEKASVSMLLDRLTEANPNGKQILARHIRKNGGINSLREVVDDMIVNHSDSMDEGQVFGLQNKLAEIDIQNADAKLEAAMDGANRAFRQNLDILDNARNQTEFDAAMARFDDVNYSLIQQELVDDLGVRAGRVAERLDDTAKQVDNLTAKVDDAARQSEVSESVRNRPEPSGTQPETAQQRLNRYFEESGIRDLDEARFAKEGIGTTRTEAGLAKKAKAMGISVEDAKRLKASLDDTDPNIKALLKEKFDPETGIGQQRFGDELPLEDPEIQKLYSQLTPEEQEIARIAQQAMKENRPMVTEFAKEISGSGSGTASGRGGEIATETPIGFTKSGKDLAIAVYNEDGNYRVRKLIPKATDTSRFINKPRILSNQQPYVGPYANVYKGLGQFNVNDMLNRLPAESPIKSSDIQKLLEFSQRVANDPNQSPAFKRHAQIILDRPTPRNVRRWMAEANRIDEATATQYMEEARIRC